MPKSERGLRIEQNLRDLAAQVVEFVKKGKVGADGTVEKWTNDEINEHLNKLRIDAEYKLSEEASNTVPIPRFLSAAFIGRCFLGNHQELSIYNNASNASNAELFLADQILLGINADLSAAELLDRIGLVDLRNPPKDYGAETSYLYAKFEQIKSENGLPEDLTIQEFGKLLALVSDNVVDAGNEMSLNGNRAVVDEKGKTHKADSEEEKNKLKAERQLLALVGSGKVAALGDKKADTTHNRIAKIAIKLAKDPTKREEIRGLLDPSKDAAQAIKKAAKEIENEAAIKVTRIFRENVARKKSEQHAAEKEARAAKEKTEAEEAAKKALTDDGWPKHLTRPELGKRGYLPNQINIFGTPDKSSAHHGSELYESGLVVQLFEDDGNGSPSGSFEVSRQIGVIAKSKATTGVAFVRTKPFGGAASYQAIIATSLGVVQTFIDASDFEKTKIHAGNFFKTELVGVLDQAAIKSDFQKCLAVYDEAGARLEHDSDAANLSGDAKVVGEINELKKRVSEQKKAIEGMLAAGETREAFKLISMDIVSPNFFSDEEKLKLRSLRNVTIDKATDAQKETARALAASKFSEFVQIKTQELVDNQARHLDLDSQEVEGWAKKMSVDPAKAKSLLNQPAPPCRFGSTAIMRPKGSNTAIVTFNNDVSQNNIVYLAVPNTKNAYIRVIRIPEKGSVGVFQNGKLQMVTSDKPGIIAIDEGVVWRCTESGDHEPVELSSKGKGFPKYEWENVKANVKNFNVKAMSISGDDRYMQTMCEGKVVGAQLNQRIFEGRDSSGEAELVIKRDKDGKIENPDDLPEVVLRTIDPNPPRADGLTAKLILRLKPVTEEKSAVTKALLKLGAKDDSTPKDQKYTTEMVLAYYNADGSPLTEEYKTNDKPAKIKERARELSQKKGELTEDSIELFLSNPKRGTLEEKTKAAKEQTSEIIRDISKMKLVVRVENHEGKETTEAISIKPVKSGLFDSGKPLPAPSDASAVLLARDRISARTAG